MYKCTIRMIALDQHGLLTFAIYFCDSLIYLSSTNFNVVSTSEWIVRLCRFSPMVAEKTLKLWSSKVVYKTPSSTSSIPKSLKVWMFSYLSFIIQIASSITNLLILETLVGGYQCFLRISLNLFGSSSSVILDSSNIILDS